MPLKHRCAGDHVVEAGDFGLQAIIPGRIGRRTVDQPRPDIARRDNLAALEIGKAEEVLRSRMARVNRLGPPEGLHSGRRHETIGMADQCQTQRQPALNIARVIGQPALEEIGRIGKLAAAGKGVALARWSLVAAELASGSFYLLMLAPGAAAAALAAHLGLSPTSCRAPGSVHTLHLKGEHAMNLWQRIWHWLTHRWSALRTRQSLPTAPAERPAAPKLTLPAPLRPCVSVVIPALNEQKRIADKLDSVLARVDACRDRLDDLPVGVVGFLRAVEPRIHVPRADVVVRLDLLHRGGGLQQLVRPRGLSR